jgi:hypothetical protein
MPSNHGNADLCDVIISVYYDMFNIHQKGRVQETVEVFRPLNTELRGIYLFGNIAAV